MRQISLGLCFFGALTGSPAVADDWRLYSLTPSHAFVADFESKSETSVWSAMVALQPEIEETAAPVTYVRFAFNCQGEKFRESAIITYNEDGSFREELTTDYKWSFPIPGTPTMSLFNVVCGGEENLNSKIAGNPHDLRDLILDNPELQKP